MMQTAATFRHVTCAEILKNVDAARPQLGKQVHERDLKMPHDMAAIINDDVDRLFHLTGPPFERVGIGLRSDGDLDPRQLLILCALGVDIKRMDLCPMGKSFFHVAREPP